MLGRGAELGQKPAPEQFDFRLLKLRFRGDQPIAAAAWDRLTCQRHQTAALDIAIDQRRPSQYDTEAAHGRIESHLNRIDAEPVVDRRRNLDAAGPKPLMP